MKPVSISTSYMKKSSKIHSFRLCGMMKFTITIATCLVLCLVLLLPSSSIFNSHKSHSKPIGFEQPRDILLGGLLTTEFDKESCLSRYDQSMRKPSPYRPSGYLVTKLRSYEMLHNRCGPGTDAYKRAVDQLGHHDVTSSGESIDHCIKASVILRNNKKTHKQGNLPTKSLSYASTVRSTHESGFLLTVLVSVHRSHLSPSSSSRFLPFYGGSVFFQSQNRVLLFIVSFIKLPLSITVFLYALLTDRVMLVDQRNDITDLFCEPFPGTSWLLPLSFPLTSQLDSFDREHSQCYGTMLKNHAINSTTIPSHLYLDIFHDSRDQDKMFFCEGNQEFIQKVPWLVVKSNIYFVPSLWMSLSFQTELSKLFPQKDTAFHHLSRYLFHPTNQVWGMVTRAYNAYLARADERLGIQVRVFSKPAGYFQHVMDQILSCTQREKLLPEFATSKSQVTNNTSRISKLKAVLVTSLHPEYSDKLSNMFWEQPSSTGEIIEVYQPSGERVQQTDKKIHDQKALVEIYLLSLTDKLVTSTRSTFGYVAQGIGGLTPWILYEPKDRTAPDPPCVKAMSMEPCLLRAPYGCPAKPIKTTPFIKNCEDWGGLKVVDV